LSAKQFHIIRGKESRKRERNGKLFHRWCVLDAEPEIKPIKRRSEVVMTLQNQTYPFESIADAFVWFMDMVKEEADVSLTMSRLDFVGRRNELMSKLSDGYQIRSLDGDLFMLLNPKDKKDTIDRMTEIASLFYSFRDFSIE
jgi:hypothetical protein